MLGNIIVWRIDFLVPGFHQSVENYSQFFIVILIEEININRNNRI